MAKVTVRKEKEQTKYGRPITVGYVSIDGVRVGNYQTRSRGHYRCFLEGPSQVRGGSSEAIDVVVGYSYAANQKEAVALIVEAHRLTYDPAARTEVRVRKAKSAAYSLSSDLGEAKGVLVACIAEPEKYGSFAERWEEYARLNTKFLATLNEYKTALAAREAQKEVA